MKASIVVLCILALCGFIVAGCEEEAGRAYNCTVISTPAELDFGEIYTHETNSMTFTAKLDCDEGGTERNIVIQGESTTLDVIPREFTLVDGEKQDVQVTVNYENLGPFTHELTLTTGDDDDAENPLTVTGTLYSESYYIYENPHTIEFGEIVTDEEVTHKIAVLNSSYAEEGCTLTISSDITVADISPLEITLNPGEDDTIVVAISSADEIINVEGTIYGRNPENQGLVQVPVTGSILGIPLLEVDPGSLDFGTVTDEQTLTLHFSNPGNGMLDQATIELSPGDPVYSFASEDTVHFDSARRQFSLPLGEDLDVDVTLTCGEDPGNHDTDFLIWSTELEDTLRIPVMGDCK
jgi:hypothetical protein